MSRWLAGWRVALRMARRDAARARGRSVLVLLMIALPVLGVTAADVLISTQDLSSRESLGRRLGSADAEVRVQRNVSRIVQGVDPDVVAIPQGRQDGPRPDAAAVAERLDGARLVEERHGDVAVRTPAGRGNAEGFELDLRDPVAAGLFRLTDGRWPQDAGEVVVNAALAEEGYAVGDRLVTPSERRADPRIVGLAESTTVRDYPVVAGPIGSLRTRSYGTQRWLVDAGGPVTWAQVRDLNRIGASVLSRHVVEHPPSHLPPAVQDTPGPSPDTVMAAVLVVVMALIEVVLLAGPAFAVGARRLTRSLALLAATGGTPPQSRRVVLAGAVVLGSVAAATGVGLGIGTAWLLEPVLQRLSLDWFGPFDVPWLHLLGIAGFGLLSAVLAAVVPAWIASRQDVVAVLSGRRGDRHASLRSPLLGALLLGAGVAAAAWGALRSTGGEVWIAGSAVLAVLGMVLLVPVVLVLVGRLGRRLPLALRYAARDAARHRTRTVPAVAAVAATVAGVVALGIATASDEAQNAGTYQPSLVRGAGVLTVGHPADADWDALRGVVERELPDAAVQPVSGLVDPEGRFLHVQISSHKPDRLLLDMYGSVLGADVLVSDGPIPDAAAGLSDAARARAEQALRVGRPVVFTNQGASDGTVRIQAVGDGRGRGRHLGAVRTEATVVPVAGTSAGPQAVLPPAIARELGADVATVGLTLTGTDLGAEQEKAVSEGAAAIVASSNVYVERGYQADSETVIIELVLFGLGAVLMLGGTLTATFLALSDARPDLATLAAVGAAPRTRRGVAAAYAVVVGLVGAVLGVVVGFVPGVAVSYPLTSGWRPSGADLPSHFLDVPWLLVASLVVVLPLLTAAMVGLCVRSRLPLVARLD